MLKQVVACDSCGCVIESTGSVLTGNTPNSNIRGYAVLGNVHVVNPTEHNGVGGGLIGNNLSEDNEEVNTSHYCRNCFLKLLGVDYTSVR